VQKFLHGMPTNRILKDLALRGLGLAAGSVTDGYKVINDLLEPSTKPSRPSAKEKITGMQMKPAGASSATTRAKGIRRSGGSG